jgi:hypothetical protein
MIFPVPKRIVTNDRAVLNSIEPGLHGGNIRQN